MPDLVDCGECPGISGCYGKCSKAQEREHDAAIRHGQLGLNLSNPVQSLGVALRDLLAEAKRTGVVIEVRLVPLEPLAMGHYAMVGTVRNARGHGNG